MKHTTILGGGQLARMLIGAAGPLGFRPSVYVQAVDEPAVPLADCFVQGSWSDEGALRKFLAQATVTIFENEFVDLNALKNASRGLPVRFSPSLEIFAQIQHKRDQKQLLIDLGFPTAPFQEFASLEEYKRDRARTQKPHVLKWGCRGYDGKGILLVDKVVSEATISKFFKDAGQAESLVFAEDIVPFIRELALVAFRSAIGEKLVYPLVVSAQEEGICWWVKGPATQLGVSEIVEKRARDIALRLLDALSWEGPLAIEFFQIGENEISINELAPRVHNSAHYTQNAGCSSQFENQWRAALGLPLGPAEGAAFFAMRNLLGPPNFVGTPDHTPHGLPQGAYFHWYGKKEVRPKRKIGHINLTADTRLELDAKCESVDTWVRTWESSWQKQK